MLTKRRTLPASSQMRSFRPGKALLRCSRTSPMFEPAACTTSISFVSLRGGVGMRTEGMGYDGDMGEGTRVSDFCFLVSCFTPRSRGEGGVLVVNLLFEVA